MCVFFVLCFFFLSLSNAPTKTKVNFDDLQTLVLSFDKMAGKLGKKKRCRQDDRLDDDESVMKLEERLKSAHAFLDCLEITNASFLDELSERTNCPKCNKSRKYYCYTCFVPVTAIEDRVPKVELPINVDIIKHPKEVDGKSTAAHLAVLAPQQVRVYIYPDVPSYTDTKVALIFPGPGSLSLSSLIKESEDSAGQSSGGGCSKFPFDRIVLIDSTWNQTTKIINDDRIQNLPRIELKSHDSIFWRYQRGKPRTYLATVEAVYWFLREFQPEQTHDYDNLLFFFKYMFEKIHSLYDPRTLSIYTRVQL